MQCCDPDSLRLTEVSEYTLLRDLTPQIRGAKPGWGLRITTWDATPPPEVKK